MKKLICLFVVFSTSLFANESVEALGERMFNDQRFSQYFYDLSGGNVNFEINEVSEVKRHQLKTCASCHKVDQDFTDIGGMRGYNDDFSRTPIPYRDDYKLRTLRNTPTLVGIGSKFAQNRFSHYDGEFHDHSQTVLGNFTGRNMGWVANEKAEALKNIVNIIRNDNGKSELAQEFGGSYEKLILGIDPSLTTEQRLPQNYRADIRKLNDDQIIDLVVKFVTAYLDGIDFEKDDDGNYIGSTYDDFLKINGLPIAPKQGQNVSDYTLELMEEFVNLKNPKFVQKKYLETHKKTYEFGPQEWQGLRIFFNITKAKADNTSRGMCLNCHMPPLFSDQQFHNVGVAQVEYDEVHGAGEFNKLKIPEYANRAKDQYFLARPNSSDKSHVDLGMWNFFGRTDKPELTKYILSSFCTSGDQSCDERFLLPYMIGRIKTPTLRNLNHSNPYFHNGKSLDLKAVMAHYVHASDLMKKGELRNGAPQLRRINLTEQDQLDLAAFLETLNSEYD